MNQNIVALLLWTCQSSLLYVALICLLKLIVGSGILCYTYAEDKSPLDKVHYYNTWFPNKLSRMWLHACRTRCVQRKWLRAISNRDIKVFRCINSDFSLNNNTIFTNNSNYDFSTQIYPRAWVHSSRLFSAAMYRRQVKETVVSVLAIFQKVHTLSLIF